MLKRALVIVAAIAAPNIASADAIYGCWTNGTERLIVEYQKIVTPGGASPDAAIDRHNAQYLAPENERDAGRLLAFRQLNDSQLARTVLTESGGQPVGAREIWAPCDQDVHS